MIKINYINKIRLYDDTYCIDGRALHRELQIKTEYAKWFKRKIDNYNFIETKDYKLVLQNNIKTNNGGRSLKYFYITIEMAKQLCIKERRNEIAPLILKELLELNNENLYIIEPERPEIIFIDKLEQSLNALHIHGDRQYKVLNYRIDYYISSLNIAIEYDENNHKNYTYEKQELRQAEIEKELGCRFIRVSDKNTDEYNIGLVFKELFQIAC